MDVLELQLNVNSSFELIPTKTDALLQEVSAEILLYPQDDMRQELIDWSSEGIVKEDYVSFFWDDRRIEKKEFSYDAEIRTQNKNLKVLKKFLFPCIRKT